MAGVLVINPRRKTHRRAKARKTARPTKRRRKVRRARPNPFAATRRRKVRRRRRHSINPRGALIQNLTNGALVASGIIGARLASGWLSKVVPPEWSSGPNASLVRIGSKLAFGVALPLLLKPVLGGKMKSAANWVAVGAAAAVALDVFETYVAPNVPGLSDYEMAGYENNGGGLALGDGDEVDEVETLGAGTMYDTVYG